MKTPIILFTLTIIVLLIGLLLPEALSAQPAPRAAPVQNPIDGGLALLAAVGGGYAM